MCRCKIGRSGSVLVILLWMLMIMSIMCISFSKAVRVEANAVANGHQLTQAYCLAQAGIASTIYKMIVYVMEAGGNRLVDPNAELQPLDIELGKVNLNTEAGDAVINIYDENGKINLNMADKNLLMNLMLSLGVEELRADIISDSILDWRDPDEDHHLNGAETDYYQTLTHPYKSRNAPFETVEELLLIREVDASIFYGHAYKDADGVTKFLPGLNQCLTVFGASSGVNVNSAPYPVLIAIGIPPDMASNIIRQRAIKPFRDQQDFNLRVPEAPGMGMLKTPIITRSPMQSSYFSLIATGIPKNSNLKKTICALIKLDAGVPLKHRVVYWNENYFLQEQE